MKNENKNQDWQSEIGTFFNDKKIYRLDFLHKQLYDIVNEWNSYLKKFDDVRPEMDINHCDAEFNNYNSIFIKINLRSQVRDYFPFVIFLGYMTNEDNTDIVLKLKYYREISDYILDGHFKPDDKLVGIFHEEVLDGEEIFEKEFIFWKVNDLLKKWLNSDTHTN